jgi:DNA mismatch repair protein MutS2
LDDLAFTEVLKALAARCRTSAGRERAARRPFLESTGEVVNALALVEEARRLAEQQLSLPLSGLEDVRVHVERAAKGGLLEPKELLAVAHVTLACARLRELLEERDEWVPGLAAIARRLPSLPHLATRIERCFEPSGELSDRASPALKEARDRSRGLHRAIKERLDQLLHDERFSLNLRESYYTLRNDRYVLPVMASHRGEVPGIVHNASQTGQTLFVEPQAMIGLGNDLAIAQSLVLEEERRILLELSDAVGRESARLVEGVAAYAELDEAEAAAALAGALRATIPEIEEGNSGFELRNLRHPLLVLRGKEVVANDVRLSPDQHALVISGPNAGGKTVTLTAVGLCALMLRAGLPLPAGEGSRLPLFRSVHSAVGDAQDLSKDLSTFSAHLLQLRQIAEGAGRGSLVLIDEIAADTDPREGAAIAIAVLEELIGQGAFVLVTTHLEELKALAHMDARFLNARVGFDASKLAPTYRLQLGFAGASSAIEIAERMGLPERLCQRARELALGTSGSLARALRAVEDERRRISEELETARKAAEEAVRLRRELEAERAELTRRRSEEETSYHQALRDELQRARLEIRGLVDALKSKPIEVLKSAQKEVFEREQEHAERAEQARAVLEPAGETRFEPVVGAWVHHRGLSQDVEILEVDGNEALVAAGPLKARVKLSALSAPKKSKPKAQFPAGAQKGAKALQRAEEAAPAALPASGGRCDLRGMRADEAMREVEQFLDRVYGESIDSVTLVHGHGTGALKQMIREYLDRSPYVRMFRPGSGEEGGDGVTIVALRR